MRARMSSDDSFGPLLHFPNVFLKPPILTYKKEVSLNAKTIKLERILHVRDLFN